VLEPKDNPNPKVMVDPPRPLRWLMSKLTSRRITSKHLADNRAKFETQRKAAGAAHRVEYFHQLDDPYSHLTAQVLARFAARYDIELVPHLVRVSGGKHQPELEKLATWARADACMVAPHFDLSFPDGAGTVPDATFQSSAARALCSKSDAEFVAAIADVSAAQWNGGASGLTSDLATEAEASTALDEGSARLQELGHYSGAMFYYGGEWYWGVDRLFHLEQRLMDLGLRRDKGADYLVPRPEIDVSGVDASNLMLHFYPSFNSPYTSIIYDKTIETAKACNIHLAHKPVLPMIMRGVAASQSKVRYIMLDTKREADFFGVPFGPFVTPIGTPTRKAYSLLPWARSQGKDVDLLRTLLRHAWSEARPLYKTAAMRKAVEEAGLNWTEASTIIGDEAWKHETERNQDEMVEGMGLWGVPSYRLSGPGDEPDLAVWGQDRLWLIAAEIKRRAVR